MPRYSSVHSRCSSAAIHTGISMAVTQHTGLMFPVSRHTSVNARITAITTAAIAFAGEVLVFVFVIGNNFFLYCGQIIPQRLVLVKLIILRYNIDINYNLESRL